MIFFPLPGISFKKILDMKPFRPIPSHFFHIFILASAGVVCVFPFNSPVVFKLLRCSNLVGVLVESGAS